MTTRSDDSGGSANAESECPGRIIAIGDIHGCSTALDLLLTALALTPDDLVVPLGDFVDCGPDSRGVINRLISLGSVCRVIALLGNHERMLLDARASEPSREFWMRCGGQETLDSYDTSDHFEIPSNHLAFIRECKRFLETDTHIFAHANPAPNRPMGEQSDNDLLWRPLDPAKIGRHYSGKTIVVGHTPQPGGQILDLDFLKCIDTACHSGGWLTALDVQSGGALQASQKGQVRAL